MYSELHKDTKLFDIPIELMGKPRMVKSDSWKKRECVQRYWALKDELNLKANLAKFKLPLTYHAVIVISMPQSWSKKRKEKMDGKPCMQKPDKDNLEKTLCDCLPIVEGLDDKAVYDSRVTKIWGYEGRLTIYEM
jgi:Holliday junction resolvase RusA-like endonuclease